MSSPPTSGSTSAADLPVTYGPMLLGTFTTITASLPLFLIGAVAVQITDELLFGAAALGAASGLAQAMRATVGAPVGRLVDRLGATRSLRIGVAISGTASVGIAATAFNWLSVVAWMLVAAVGHTFVEPAGNRLMVNRVRADRLGIAFGVKQAGPPASTAIAGMSVPIIAITVGWRWTYVLSAVIATIVFLCIPASSHPRSRGQRRRRDDRQSMALGDRKILFFAAAGFGLGFLASAVVLTFFVDSAVGAGVPERLAGVMLAAAGIASVIVRIAVGMLCDRRRVGPFRVGATLLTIGVVGHGLLATAIPLAMSIGVVVALAGAWGFPSTFWLGLMRAFPDTPGRVTGAIAPAVLVGGGAGPFAFGVIAETTGYRVAWGFAAIAAAAAAAALAWAAIHIDRRETSRTATATDDWAVSRILDRLSDSHAAVATSVW